MATPPLKIQVTANIAALPEAEAAILRGLIAGLEKIGDRGVGLVVEGTPVGATGQLAHTVFPHLEQGADSLTEIITNGPPADVYAAPVNDGSRPHFPPYEALIPWVIKKFGMTDEKSARSIAFVIARKIARSGTAPVGQYDQAWQQLMQEAQGILELELGTSLEQAGYSL